MADRVSMQANFTRSRRHWTLAICHQSVRSRDFYLYLKSSTKRSLSINTFININTNNAGLFTSAVAHENETAVKYSSHKTFLTYNTMSLASKLCEWMIQLNNGHRGRDASHTTQREIKTASDWVNNLSITSRVSQLTTQANNRHRKMYKQLIQTRGGRPALTLNSVLRVMTSLKTFTMRTLMTLIQNICNRKHYKSVHSCRNTQHITHCLLVWSMSAFIHGLVLITFQRLSCTHQKFASLSADCITLSLHWHVRQSSRKQRLKR